MFKKHEYFLRKNEYNSMLFLMNTLWSFKVIYENPRDYIIDDVIWLIENR